MLRLGFSRVRCEVVPVQNRYPHVKFVPRGPQLRYPMFHFVNKLVQVEHIGIENLVPVLPRARIGERVKILKPPPLLASMVDPAGPLSLSMHACTRWFAEALGSAKGEKQ